jgi:hypothetical protein
MAAVLRLSLRAAPRTSASPSQLRHCTASSLRQRASSIPPDCAIHQHCWATRPINRHSLQDSERIRALRGFLHRGSFDACQQRGVAHSHSCDRWQASNNPKRQEASRLVDHGPSSFRIAVIHVQRRFGVSAVTISQNQSTYLQILRIPY